MLDLSTPLALWLVMLSIWQIHLLVAIVSSSREDFRRLFLLNIVFRVKTMEHSVYVRLVNACFVVFFSAC